MADKSPVPGPTLAEKREKTIQLLIDSFASDRLTVEDYESRLDLANKATKITALEKIVEDLPAARDAESPATAPAPLPAPARPENIRESQFLAAVLGGVERKGGWTPARKTWLLSFMGGAVLDFREAHLPPGVTEVELFVMMGGVEIIVPPGVAVDSSGIAIMGSFEHGPGAPPGMPADAPVIRVGGFALMGGVEVHTRLPGESARDAKLRRREERKRLRRGATGD
jgi:hypothetical protein